MRCGQRVGKYVLGERIARGGMAEVWAARVEGPAGFVKSLALKFILESFAGDVDLERLFVNEARIAASLSHANLVSVFDFDKISDGDPGNPGRYYIAMERVDGHDLRRVVQMARHKGQRLPSAMALHVAAEVLKGLRYVHERMEESGRRPLGLVHRDVSPHNVLIGLGGEVKLSDFGIAKAMTQSLGTQAGTIRGKLAYASPEQLRSEPVDHRTDQFGLGVTLWEMLADRRLFDGTSEKEIVARVLRCEIPPLPTDAAIGPAVESVVRRMLADQRGDRFPSTAEALSAVLAAPGYQSDPADLVDLMKTLFGQPTIVLPPTVPLNIPDVKKPGGLAQTSLLERNPIAAGSAQESIRLSADPADAVNGSAYVSGAAPSIPAWIDRPRGSGGPNRVVLVTAAALMMGVGGIALVARHVDRSPSRAKVTIPDVPRPSPPERVRTAGATPIKTSDRKQADSTPAIEASLPQVAPPGSPPVSDRGSAIEMGASSPPDRRAVDVAAPSPWPGRDPLGEGRGSVPRGPMAKLGSASNAGPRPSAAPAPASAPGSAAAVAPARSLGAAPLIGPRPSAKGAPANGAPVLE